MTRRGRDGRLEAESLHWQLILSGMGRCRRARNQGWAARPATVASRERRPVARPSCRSGPVGYYPSLLEPRRIGSPHRQGSHAVPTGIRSPCDRGPTWVAAVEGEPGSRAATNIQYLPGAVAAGGDLVLVTADDLGKNGER
jgi:hypothetical protein